MKRIGMLCLGLVFLSGCGTSAPDGSVADQNEATPAAGDQAMTSGEVATASTPSPGTALPRNSEVMALVEKIDAETRAANEALAASDFEKARAHWSNAEKLLINRYGANAWQSRSATVARVMAEEQCQLGSSDRLKLRELFLLQQKISTALADGNNRTALNMSLDASNACESLFPIDSMMVAKQRIQLARLYQLNQDYSKALELYRASRVVQIGVVGSAHPDIESIHGFMGECFMALNQYPTAIENFKEAARIAQRAWGEDSLNYAIRANDLGVAFHKMHDLPIALKILRAAESIRRNRLGMDHPLVAHSLYNLAAVYVDMDRPQLAQQCLEQSLPVLEKAMGAEHPMVFDCKSKLAVTLMLLNEVDAAEPMLRDLLAANQKRQADPRAIAACQFRLGVAHARQTNYESAETLLTTALNTQSAVLGDGNAETRRTRMALATMYRTTNREELAKSLFQDVREVDFQETANSGSSFESLMSTEYR